MRLIISILLSLALIAPGAVALAAIGDYEVYGADNAPVVNGLYEFVNFGLYTKAEPPVVEMPIYRNGNYWLTHRGCALEWILLRWDDYDGDFDDWNACTAGPEYTYGALVDGELIDGRWYPPVGTWTKCQYDDDNIRSPLPYPIVSKAAAPTPATMTFSSAPYDISISAIRMVASLASDPSGGVHYFFDYYNSPTGGSGGTDSTSGGQTSRTYTDNGLGANHQYRYRVRARDEYDHWNNYSTIAAVYTAIEEPTGITFGTVKANSIQAQSTNTPSGLTRGSSGLLIYNATANTNSGWKRDNNFWNSTGLVPNTAYTFRARARNGDGHSTGYCDPFSLYTAAGVPVSASFSAITRTSVRANWTANGNPAGTQYYCENTTRRTNSGWTTNTYWNSSGLTCGQGYGFRVRARNSDGVTTGWTSLGTGTTLPCPGALAVSPADGLDASGYVGGPFSPSRTYTLTNTGGIAIDWTVAGTAGWVSVSPASGTLNPGANATVTVSINSGAESLAVGSYNDTVTFTNTTNGNGDTSRSVSLTVSPLPGDLVVTPLTGLTSTGIEGGPFTPGSVGYTLNNAGGSPLDWTASKTETWVSLSRTSGTLAAGASTTVTVSVDADANALSPGNYSDTVTFADTTNSVQSTRPVNLTVDPVPGSLSLSPAGATAFSGMAGGPFSPAGATYTLENTGGVSIEWNMTNDNDWLAAAPSGGTLGPGERTDVTLSVNSTADSLEPADYDGNLAFTNTTNGNDDTSRGVSLHVQGEIALGLMDDFESGTLRNWFFGSDGGPSAGTPTLATETSPANNYLLVDADETNMDGKLVIQNDNQWTGNWTAAGVHNIGMRLKNMGAQSLEMRLALVNPDNTGVLTGGCASTIGALVPPGRGNWQTVSFPVEADDFTCSATIDIHTLLTDVSMLRLLHATDTVYNGEAIVARLGVDDIKALACGVDVTIDPAGAGEVVLEPAGEFYADNTQVTFTANPGTGWRFSRWSGGLVGDANPASLAVDANVAITATFESLATYGVAVSVLPEGVGTVTLDPQSGSYYDGTGVTLRAEVTDPYYECGTWTVNSQDMTDSNQPCQISLTVDADKAVAVAFVLKDSDGDGVSDQEEDGSPLGTDCNRDGTQDKEQPNVVNLKTLDGQHYLTIVSEPGTKVSGCRSAPNPDPENCPEWADFQFGFFEFTIENLASAATMLEFIFPDNLAQGFRMPNSYYKYGPTPDNQIPHWYRFKYEQNLAVGATFEDNVIRLYLVDNELGDDDSTVGVITDIGGPGLVDNPDTSPAGGPSGGTTSSGGGGGGGCFVSTLCIQKQ